jgi:hypothetical protein
LWSFRVDEADHPWVGTMLSVALDSTTATYNEVDFPISDLKRIVGIATLRRRWRSTLLAKVAIITSVIPMIFAVIVAAAIAAIIVVDIMAIITGRGDCLCRHRDGKVVGRCSRVNQIDDSGYHKNSCCNGRHYCRFSLLGF